MGFLLAVAVALAIPALVIVVLYQPSDSPKVNSTPSLIRYSATNVFLFAFAYSGPAAAALCAARIGLNPTNVFDPAVQFLAHAIWMVSLAAAYLGPAVLILVTRPSPRSRLSWPWLACFAFIVTLVYVWGVFFEQWPWPPFLENELLPIALLFGVSSICLAMTLFKGVYMLRDGRKLSAGTTFCVASACTPIVFLTSWVIVFFE